MDALAPALDELAMRALAALPLDELDLETAAAPEGGASFASAMRPR